MGVYDLPEENHPTYARKLLLLTWYVNDWLVKCAGYEHYGRNIRPYVLAVNTKMVEGKKVPYVSQESEGFGRLLFENCREKWMHTLPHKCADESWTVPPLKKKDESTHKYHATKYSDSNTGQVKGSGWSPEAYIALGNHIEVIKKFRKEDKKKKWKTHRFCKKIIRTKLDVTAKKHDKKRKRGKEKAAPPKYEPVKEMSDCCVSTGDDASDDDE
jgi:hypothetical protein